MLHVSHLVKQLLTEVCNGPVAPSSMVYSSFFIVANMLSLIALETSFVVGNSNTASPFRLRVECFLPE